MSQIVETHIKASIENTQARVEVWKAELSALNAKTGSFFKQEGDSLRNRIKHAEAQVEHWLAHLEPAPPPDPAPSS